MPSAENAILYYEAGQTLEAYAELTDQGDHKDFKSADNFWSKVSGYAPVVRPNGIVTGANRCVIPAVAGTDDLVDTLALTAYLAGVSTTVAAGTGETITRATDDYIVLTLAASGYTNCVAGDIGKTVTGGSTGDTGVLRAYNNTTRQWVVEQTDVGDTFDDDDEALTIGTGTGAGDMEGVGVMSSHKISSVTITSAGAIAIVAGTEGTSFSESRGVIGGPPFIPTTSIEVAQVRLDSATAAAITADEIFVTPGTHQEWYNYPTWTVESFDVENNILGYAGVLFTSALPLIHTGSLPKKVYAQYYTPTFAEVPKSSDFVPPANSHSVSSKQVYGETVGSKSSSIGQGSFTAEMEDGISDGLLNQIDKNIFFKFLQDRLKTPYIICQGYLGVTNSFPAGDSITASCTISAEAVAKRVVG